MKLNIIKTATKYCMAIIAMSMIYSCDLDPRFYSKDSPDTFFTGKDNVYSILARPYSHWRYNICTSERWYIEVLTTDEMACPVRGQDWENQGYYKRLHYHTWDAEHTGISSSYTAYMRGVSQCLESKAILEEVDYHSLGFTDADRDNHFAMLNSLIAYFYLRSLNLWGGMPLYESVHESDLVARSSDKETFDFIERLLTESIPVLAKRGSLTESIEGGYINQGVAASLLARLYFNAEAYIGVAMYDECAKICQNIIDGVYGPYDLESVWYMPFSFDNDKSPEMIWAVPSKNATLQEVWWTRYFFPYNAQNYFGVVLGQSCYNGFGLSPSYDPQGRVYTGAPHNHKLGAPFVAFSEGDLRAKPYRYLGNEKREGMLLMGELINPNDPSQRCLATRADYQGQLVNLVDMVAPFIKLGTEYPNRESLPSNMDSGEEVSLYRLVKLTIPTADEQSEIFNADNPIIRLAEIYYMLAECKMRGNDKAGAATLINKVRARNFEGADPDPVTADNLDMYRMLKEWMIEFIGEGEGRRRTDLIRWGQFVSGEWWDHEAHNDTNKNRFPIPTEAIAANNLLEQNPGY